MGDPALSAGHLRFNLYWSLSHKDTKARRKAHRREGAAPAEPGISLHFLGSRGMSRSRAGLKMMVAFVRADGFPFACYGLVFLGGTQSGIQSLGFGANALLDSRGSNFGSSGGLNAAQPEPRPQAARQTTNSFNARMLLQVSRGVTSSSGRCIQHGFVQGIALGRRGQCMNTPDTVLVSRDDPLFPAYQSVRPRHPTLPMFTGAGS